MNARKTDVVDTESYLRLINEIKEDIQKSQLRAALSVTRELTALYWRTGKRLSEKVEKEGWGAQTISSVAKDLSGAFPEMSSFSHRNIYFMKQFAEIYPADISEMAVSEIPWGHNIALLQKLEDNSQRLWYAAKTIENGWSRAMLLWWIESDLYGREGKALNNFKNALPSPQSDLAEQTLKDPYNLSFLTLESKFREKELEQGLTDHIQKFLLELGQGFSFVKRQYTFEVGGKEYAIDLLFYHLVLRCYVVVELKATEFDPRDVGQLNFYLSAIDDLVKHSTDQPTLGMILCKTKNKVVVEYSLRKNQNPIGVASYETKLTESLPENFKSSLPTVEEIEAELSKQEVNI